MLIVIGVEQDETEACVAFAVAEINLRKCLLRISEIDLAIATCCIHSMLINCFAFPYLYPVAVLFILAQMFSLNFEVDWLEGLEETAALFGIVINVLPL